MKIKVLKEATRGEDVAKRSEIKSQVNQLIDDPRAFFTMSEVDRIGVYPLSKYSTPLGIYTYPFDTKHFLKLKATDINEQIYALKKTLYSLRDSVGVKSPEYEKVEEELENLYKRYDIEKENKQKKLPFRDDAPLIHVFLADWDRMLNFEKYTDSDFERDLKILNDKYTVSKEKYDDLKSDAKFYDFIVSKDFKDLDWPEEIQKRLKFLPDQFLDMQLVYFIRHFGFNNLLKTGVGRKTANRIRDFLRQEYSIQLRPEGYGGPWEGGGETAEAKFQTTYKTFTSSYVEGLVQDSPYNQYLGSVPAVKIWALTWFLTNRLTKDFFILNPEKRASDEYDAQETKEETYRTRKWASILSRDLGYDGATDPKYGIIHQNEPIQTVFFPQGGRLNIVPVVTMENRSYYSFTSNRLKHYIDVYKSQDPKKIGYDSQIVVNQKALAALGKKPLVNIKDVEIPEDVKYLGAEQTYKYIRNGRLSNYNYRDNRWVNANRQLVSDISDYMNSDAKNTPLQLVFKKQTLSFASLPLLTKFPTLSEANIINSDVNFGDIEINIEGALIINNSIIQGDLSCKNGAYIVGSNAELTKSNLSIRCKNNFNVSAIELFLPFKNLVTDEFELTFQEMYKPDTHASRSVVRCNMLAIHDMNDVFNEKLYDAVGNAIKAARASEKPEATMSYIQDSEEYHFQLLSRVLRPYMYFSGSSIPEVMITCSLGTLDLEKLVAIHFKYIIEKDKRLGTMEPDKVADQEKDNLEENTQPKVRKFTYDELDDAGKQSLYDMFKVSYEKSTGKAWSQGLFRRRVENWTFYGSPEKDAGVIAVRKQASGLNKLVSTSGNIFTVRAAIPLMLSDIGSEPIWSLVSPDLVSLAEKQMKLLSAPSFIKKMISGSLIANLLPVDKMVDTFIKAVIGSIPPSVFGGYDINILDDGGVEVEIAEIGKVKKYLVANEAYYKTMLSNSDIVGKIREKSPLVGNLIDRFSSSQSK